MIKAKLSTFQQDFFVLTATFCVIVFKSECASPQQQPFLHLVFHQFGLVVAHSKSKSKTWTKKWFGPTDASFIARMRQRAQTRRQNDRANAELKDRL